MPDVQVTSEGPLQIAQEVEIPKGEAAQKDRELLRLLLRRHPEYIDNIDIWHTLGDVALDRIRTQHHRRQYLIKGDTELTEQFDERAELSSWMPETPGLLNEFIGAVFAKPARREFLVKDEDSAKGVRSTALQKRLSEFIDAAGPEDEPLTRIAEIAAPLALTFQQVDAFLDHPTEPERTATPRIILYTPEQRLDWQIGEDGLYQWVKYREHTTVLTTWDGERIEQTDYRIISAPIEGIPGTGEVRLFRVTKRKQKQAKVEDLGTFPHSFPSIPIRSLRWTGSSPWVTPLVEADIKVFRQESDLTWDVFIHAHPWILAWLHAKMKKGENPLEQIKPGANFAYHLHPAREEMGAENLQYLAPDTAPLILQKELIEKTREAATRLAGNGSDTQVQAGARPESGIALSLRHNARARNFILLARALQEWEWQLLMLVASEGMNEIPDLGEVLRVQYPDSFDQRQAEELHADLASARMVGAPTLVKELEKELGVKLLGTGATQDIVVKVMQEIENGDVQRERPAAQPDSRVPEQSGERV